MKMKCKSGCRKCKKSPGSILEDYKEINSCAERFYKYNLGHANKFYKRASKYMSCHYKGYPGTHTKAIGRMVDIDNSPACTMNSFNNDTKAKTNVFPISEHDVCSQLVRNGMTNLQIQAILKLDGQLDFDKLKRAVILSIDAEPILGCRFVEDEVPYWKRMDSIDENTFCSLEETCSTDEAVMRFLQCPLDMSNDTNLKVKLMRSMEFDILGVKLNHSCCDGTGAKKYIQLLSDIYSRIDKDDNIYFSEHGTESCEHQNRLYEEVSDKLCRETVTNPLPETPKAMWSFPWMQRGEDSICFAVCRLPQKCLGSAYLYRNLRGASVNDLILTALYRAMFKTSKQLKSIPLDILSTIDLRSYLADYRTKVISNLSGGFIVSIPNVAYESFDKTLSRVVRETTKIKGKSSDVSTNIGEEHEENPDYAFYHNYLNFIAQCSGTAAQFPDDIRNVCFPVLSDIGYISNPLLKFENNYVTDAYLVPPVIRAPGFLLFTSSYNSLLTLSIGYYKGSVNKKDVEVFLNRVKNELTRGCY